MVATMAATNDYDEVMHEATHKSAPMLRWDGTYHTTNKIRLRLSYSDTYCCSLPSAMQKKTFDQKDETVASSIEIDFADPFLNDLTNDIL